MNVHDSERLSGLLEDAGYVRAEGEQADVVVFNTCVTRRTPTTARMATWVTWHRSRRSAPTCRSPGGCLAQKDRSEIVRRAPWVDVVFGTHNIGSLPVLLERARIQREAQVEILESLDVFPSTLPTRRESAYAAWVAVSVGCNNTCTFCIVLALRGREKDRRPGDVLAEVETLVAEGVIEVTLLGQNAQLVRRRVRGPARLRQAATRLRRDRRPRAGALHLTTPARLHRRRDRRDGGNAERHAAACTCRSSRGRTTYSRR